MQSATEVVMQNINNVLITPAGRQRDEYFKEKLSNAFFSDGIDIIMKSKADCLQAMALTGSKGSMINLKAMLGWIGWITVDNDPMKFQFGNRLNMFFKRNDVDPTSNGVIMNSYLSGLTPQEMLTNSVPERT